MDGDFGAFVDGYYRRFVNAIESFDREPLTGVLEVLDRVTEARGTLWVAGNGGSAAISDHSVCDFTKLTHVPDQAVLKCHSLVSNTPMLSALGNDLGYETVFAKQLEYYLEPSDAVLLISSSGNSPNVVEACKYAKSRGVPTIAFVGFKGGRLREMADHVVWIPVENYGIVEDTHQSLMHVLTQFIVHRTSTE